MEKSEKNNISEKELIQQCLKNNRHYQEIFYRKYADKMYSVCLIYAENEDDACDVLQDGFIKIFNKLYQFDTGKPIEAWMRKIFINTALEIFRKNKRKREVYKEYHRNSGKTYVDIIDNIGAKEIRNFVNMLPAKARMVLKLFAIEGYSHIEISEMMGITVGTSKSQLYRARTILKKYINSQDD